MQLKLSNQSRAAGRLAGFSLMELLIYISILAVISIIVANTFLSINKGRGNVEAKSELNANFHFTLEKMKRDIGLATALSVPSSAGATSSSLSMAVDGATVVYSLSSNRVARQVGAQTVEYITSENINATGLTFLRLENYNEVLDKTRVSVQISLVGSYNSTSPDWQYSQSETTTADLNQDF